MVLKIVALVADRPLPTMVALTDVVSVTASGVRVLVTVSAEIVITIVLLIVWQEVAVELGIDDTAGP